MAPKVSIIVLTINHPEVFSRLFDSLVMTAGIPYEVVVVDNGSGSESVERLKAYKRAGTITRLILEPINHAFSEGNNIGVRRSNPESEYVLLLNSDVEIFRPDWLCKMVQWAEGIPETLMPYTWSRKPTIPSPGPRDIVSIGWSRDLTVPGTARAEGWCLLIRRSLYQEMSPDFPFHYGCEEATAKMIRAGAKAGCLCQYAMYLRHYEGGTEAHLIQDQLQSKRRPDIPGWFRGLPPVETLDFALGPNEHESYLEW